MIIISEEKSLTKAADRLLITQPALSQQLKKLEKELGTRLFSRERNELCLTDAGKIYVNGARSALNIYHNAIKEINNMRHLKKNQITMVYNNALLPDFTDAILPAFTKLHSSYYISTIDGNTSVTKNYLLSNMADIAVIATRESSHSMLDYFMLYQEELMLAIPSGHKCITTFRQNGVDFSCLKDDYFILNQKNSYFRSHEQEILSHYQFSPNIICEISDLDAASHMVKNLRGNAFLPGSMAHDNNGYECFPLEPAAVFNVVIACPKSITPSRAIQDLLLLLQKNYSSGLRPELI